MKTRVTAIAYVDEHCLGFIQTFVRRVLPKPRIETRSGEPYGFTGAPVHGLGPQGPGLLALRGNNPRGAYIPSDRAGQAR